MSAFKTFTGLGLLLIALAGFLAGRSDASAQTSNDDQLQLGSRIFAENCAVCHGETGEGRVGATLSKNWPAIRPDLTVKTITERGIQGSPMPAWGVRYGGPLNETEVDAVVAYILSWQDGDAFIIPTRSASTMRPPITPAPDVLGDPNQGALLFDTNCVVCHGLEGEGRIGASLAKAWPSIRPDLTIKSTITQGVPNTNMPAWGQEYGGPLSNDQIDDIVSYILSRPDYPSTQAQPTVVTQPTQSIPWLRGWGGVLLLILLFILIIAAALYIQRNSKKEDNQP
jgi:cytochrome c oxidase cbb3-type subunit 3